MGHVAGQVSVLPSHNHCDQWDSCKSDEKLL